MVWNCIKWVVLEMEKAKKVGYGADFSVGVEGRSEKRDQKLSSVFLFNEPY